jgi:outer membrane protein OmpA-like peptidoglycan-associated protein
VRTISLVRHAAIQSAAAGLVAASLAGCATPGQQAQQAAARRVVCSDTDFPIYFDKGSDQLTSAATQTLAYTAGQLKGCRISEVEVLGLTDADARPGDALELSRRRAAVVARALAAAGLPAPVFDVAALGKLGSRVRGGAPTPLRRRTEVVIHAAPQ